MNSGDDPSDKPTLDYLSPLAGPARWKTVWHARNPEEANLAVGILQAQGMHARVDFENTAGLGIDAYSPGGTAVQVADNELAAAKAILDEIEQRQRRRLAAASVACPACGEFGARRLLHPRRKIGVAIVFVGIVWGLLPLKAGNLPLILILPGLGMIFWPMQPFWQCRACGQYFFALEPVKVEEAEEEEDDPIDESADEESDKESDEESDEEKDAD